MSVETIIYNSFLRFVRVELFWLHFFLRFSVSLDRCFNHIIFYFQTVLTELKKLRLGRSNPDFKNRLRTDRQTEVVIESLSGLKI